MLVLLILSDQLYFRAGLACNGQTIRDREKGIADFYRNTDEKLFSICGLPFKSAESQASLVSDRSEIFQQIFKTKQIMRTLVVHK